MCLRAETDKTVPALTLWFKQGALNQVITVRITIPLRLPCKKGRGSCRAPFLQYPAHGNCC